MNADARTLAEIWQDEYDYARADGSGHDYASAWADAQTETAAIRRSETCAS